ncbi:peptide/nickel transport system permease protein/oligopeptide transport system permease protein [Metamycoplasma subdolum]|uniref:Peptide/nickel transport system permease protein/oligopeptide transport system permease protein n=1 Tax=Metamycoplasma subdolum TaxID=92407 RepID=A0A3M0A834_9BACT|nr:ABC transporter permease subunit [Metamycoplasma subdolum]RMA78978.1 peptide/nickel transport system permease protein/oligopeptide transport system permease protein [Metamycoplasma subdolum]WPB50501.1 ABC transporter permease subunit [Metamycoplasma subdolum]
MKRNKALDFFYRLLIYVAIFFVSLCVIFLAINLLLTKQIKTNIAVFNQLETNIFARFGRYMRDLFSGSFGKVYSNLGGGENISIPTLYFSQFKWTILFTLITFIFALIIGNILGVWIGYKYGKTSDVLVNFLISIFATIPLILIAILALSFSHIFAYPSQFISDYPFALQSLLVPILITSFGTISLFMAKARKTTKEVLSSNYYLFAKTIGMSRVELFKKVLLKKLIINQLQTLIPFYILLITSSIVIERIFSIPGQSVFISFAFQKAEINMIMYFFFVSLLLLLIYKFIIDFIVEYLNPEQRKQSGILFFNKPKVNSLRRKYA